MRASDGCPNMFKQRVLPVPPTQPIPLPDPSTPNPYSFHSSKSPSEMKIALVLALASGFLRHSSTPEHPISYLATLYTPPPTNLVPTLYPLHVPVRLECVTRQRCTSLILSRLFNSCSFCSALLLELASWFFSWLL